MESRSTVSGIRSGSDGRQTRRDAGERHLNLLENGGVRADAERQRHDRDDRDEGGLEQRPERELEVWA
jgi:hypothetical protein